MNSMDFSNRRALLCGLGAAGCLIATGTCAADEKNLREPVMRVVNRPDAIATNHPLDPALALAREKLAFIQNEVRDYECTLVKRERIGHELQEHEYMFARIRNRKVENGKIVTPLSVYLRFLKPDNVKGREVMWVEGKNNNKLLAHEGGRLGAFTPSVWLDPNGALAMRGNRYPLTEIGVENLVLKLIEKGERDRKREDCEVNFIEAKINGRPCTLLQVKHPVKRDYFDFHIAEIYIDQQLNMPVRYAARSWPEVDGGEPPVLEEYFYANMKINVGLTDGHFDSHAKGYNFH